MRIVVFDLLLYLTIATIIYVITGDSFFIKLMFISLDLILIAILFATRDEDIDKKA